MNETFKVGDVVVDRDFGGPEREVVAEYGDQLWVIDGPGKRAVSVYKNNMKVIVPDVIEVREIIERDPAAQVTTRSISKYNSHANVIGYLHINRTQKTAVVLDHA